MSQGYTVDARLPVSPNTPKDDPSHPNNVVKNMLVVQNQTNADTKYDVVVQRLDGFTTQGNESIRLVAALIAIVVGIVIAMKLKHMIARILILVPIVWCIHYVIGRVENRTV
jgi:hypothetical protein